MAQIPEAGQEQMFSLFPDCQDRGPLNFGRKLTEHLTFVRIRIRACGAPACAAQSAIAFAGDNSAPSQKEITDMSQRRKLTPEEKKAIRERERAKHPKMESRST